MMAGPTPSDHVLTFQVPDGYALCLKCRRLLTAAELGGPCPGPDSGPRVRQEAK